MAWRRRFRGLIVVTVFLLATGSVGAQPHHQTCWTVEAKVAAFENVVVGTISRVSVKVLVAPGNREKDGYYADDNGHFQYTLTLKVEESLKGDLKGVVNDLREVQWIGRDRRYEAWATAGTRMLWFLEAAPPKGETRGWEILPLGPPVPAENLFGGRDSVQYSADFKLLNGEKDILACARAYARTSKKVLPQLSIGFRPGVLGLTGPWNSLIVPVDASLEERAKRLIAEPETFADKGNKLDLQGRIQLRFGGVNALREFKSDQNVALLRSLLDEPGEKLQTDLGRHYSVRRRALEILLQWGADGVLPKWAKTLKELDLDDGEMTEAGLKKVAELENLRILNLRNTKFPAGSLARLAPLRKLATIHLADAQFTDANLRSLREAGLLHTLSRGVDAEDERRPRSADKVTSLEVYFAPLTDVGAAEFAVFKNLTALYLDNTQVTGTGLKELAGLTRLTRLHLRKSPVTNDGLKQLASLRNLTVLALSDTNITDAGLKNLAGLDRLTELDLSGTAITGAGLKELASLKSLVKLHLGDAQFTDDTLRVLRENDMLGLIFPAEGAKRRTATDEIAVVGFLNSPITDKGLEELAGLKNLRHLSMQNTKVTGTGLKALVGLPRLSEISIRDVPLTDAGLRRLAGLKAMRTLHVHGPDVTDDRLRVLGEAGLIHLLYDAGGRADFPPSTWPPRAKSDDAVKTLDLSCTDVTDAGIKAVAGLKGLVALNVSGTKVGAAGIKELAGLKNLRRLTIGGQQVTDAALREVARLKDLTTLRLRYAPVTDAGLQELAVLENLRTLFLYSTEVTDAGIGRLQKSLPKCKIQR